MTLITGFQLETLVSWLVNLFWITALIVLMGVQLKRGFSQPWPEWSVRMVRRLVAKAGR